MAIRKREAAVYFSERAGRRFFTKRAAIKAEARAIIKNRYPTEPEERDNIGVTYRGFHWTELPNAEKLYARVCRLVKRELELLERDNG